MEAEFREGATVRLSGRREINGGTTVRPSIFRTSTLPTINQGTTVLGTVFGGTKTVQNRVNLGTTVHKTTITGTAGSLMGVGGGVGDYAADVTYSTKPNGPLLGATGTAGSLMGVGGDVGDYAADVTYSTKPNARLVYGGLPL